MVLCLENLRDYSDNFVSNSTSNYEEESERLNNILNFIYEEVFGDKLSMMNLLSKYYMTINRRNKSLYDYLNTKKTNQIKFDFSNQNFKLVNDIIDSKFENAIKKCYHDFTSITESLLSQDKVQDLIEVYKTNLNDHFNFMTIMLGFDKKKVLIRNNHLNQTNYYDRSAFYQF